MTIQVEAFAVLFHIELLVSKAQARGSLDVMPRGQRTLFDTGDTLYSGDMPIIDSLDSTGKVSKGSIPVDSHFVRRIAAIVVYIRLNGSGKWSN